MYLVLVKSKKFLVRSDSVGFLFLLIQKSRKSCSPELKRSCYLNLNRIKMISAPFLRFS